MTAIIAAWRMQAIRVLTDPSSTENLRDLARRFLAQHGGL